MKGKQIAISAILIYLAILQIPATMPSARAYNRLDLLADRGYFTPRKTGSTSTQPIKQSGQILVERWIPVYIKISGPMVTWNGYQFILRFFVQGKTFSKLWAKTFRYPNRNFRWTLYRKHGEKYSDEDSWYKVKSGYGKLGQWTTGIFWARTLPPAYLEMPTSMEAYYKLEVKIYPRVDPCDWDYKLPQIGVIKFYVGRSTQT